MAIEIAKTHRTIGDLSKQPDPIPTGVWYLRLTGDIKVKEVTKTTKEGDEYETKEYNAVAEPLKPTASVDPEALAALDPATGKPAYDGKRIFLRFTESFRNEMSQLGAMLGAMGFDKNADFDETIASGWGKGKTAYGEVFNRSYRGNDGIDKVEQRVKSWSSASAADALAI